MLDYNSKTGENFIIFAIILLTILIVSAVTYSIYLFIDISKISNAADIHVTKNLLLASKEVRGKLYSKPENGINNWIIFADKGNRYEIKYPNDMLKQTDPSCGHKLSLKKYNPAGNSLSLAVYVDVQNVADDLSIRKAMENDGIIWNDSWKQEEFGGRSGIRTGEIRDESGLIKDLVYWQFNGKIFTIEVNYFDSIIENENIFNKIISELSFI